MKCRVIISILYALTLTSCQSIGLPFSADSSVSSSESGLRQEPTIGTRGPQATKRKPPTIPDAATATVAIPSLRLRRTPHERGRVIGQVVEGEEFKLIGISSDGIWVRLEVPDIPGNMGWVAARFVSVEGDITDVPITDEAGVAEARPTPKPRGAVVATNGTRLRVRDVPNNDGEIIGYIYDGEDYNVLEISEDGFWVKVDASGTESGGWVAREFVLLESDIPNIVVDVVSTEDIDIENREAVEDISEDAGENLAEEDEEEPETVPEKSAPVVQESDPVEPNPVESEETLTPELVSFFGRAIVTTAGGRLRVRSQPNTDAEIVSYVFSGESYNIFGFNADRTWVRINAPETENGGWVSSRFIQLDIAIDDSETVSETEVIASDIDTPFESDITTSSPVDSDTTTSDADILPVPTSDPDEIVVTTEGIRLRVRSGPRTDAEIVGYVFNGDVFDVLELSEDGDWVRIAFTNREEGQGEGGWVYSRFVVLGE